jgi:hypothetical protein
LSTIGDPVRRISASLLVLLACLGASATSLVLATGASAASGTTYTPGTPEVDTIEGGPWNTSQGNPSQGGEYLSSDLLPTFAFGGPETTIGGVSEPNVAVYPSASEKEPIIPYPSGVAGTPGPLSGYCNKEESENETGSPVSQQPPGTKLPFSPYYFPDVVRNADGSLTRRSRSRSRQTTAKVGSLRAKRSSRTPATVRRRTQTTTARDTRSSRR